MTYFGISFNIHLNIIVFKKKILAKDVLKNSKNILRIKQWSKGARVSPNSMA